MATLIRLYMWGAVRLAFALFFLFHLLFYTPGGAEDIKGFILKGGNCGITGTGCRQIANYFHIFEPWPQNYALWLFDTKEQTAYRTRGEQPFYVTIPGTPIKGHGILTGDLGYSWRLNREEPAIDMLGREPWLLPLLALAATLGLSLLALLKMRRRGRAHALQEDAPHIEPYSENYAARAALAQGLRVLH